VIGARRTGGWGSARPHRAGKKAPCSSSRGSPSCAGRWSESFPTRRGRSWGVVTGAERTRRSDRPLYGSTGAAFAEKPAPRRTARAPRRRRRGPRLKGPWTATPPWSRLVRPAPHSRRRRARRSSEAVQTPRQGDRRRPVYRGVQGTPVLFSSESSPSCVRSGAIPARARWSRAPRSASSACHRSGDAAVAGHDRKTTRSFMYNTSHARRIRKIQEMMEAAEYVTDAPSRDVGALAMRLRKPLLIEGPPASGNRGREGDGPGARDEPHPLAVLRRPRRLDRALRVELPEQLLHIQLGEASTTTRHVSSRSTRSSRSPSCCDVRAARPITQRNSQALGSPGRRVRPQPTERGSRRFMLEVFSGVAG
jgi:hypothetical protein